MDYNTDAHMPQETLGQSLAVRHRSADTRQATACLDRGDHQSLRAQGKEGRAEAPSAHPNLILLCTSTHTDTSEETMNEKCAGTYFPTGGNNVPPRRPNQLILSVCLSMCMCFPFFPNPFPMISLPIITPPFRSGSQGMSVNSCLPNTNPQG